MTDKLLKRIAVLEEALKPLAAIADEYEQDGLDEARPYWVQKGTSKFDINVELYSGRGGKELLTLAHAIRAREVLTEKRFVPPHLDPFIIQVKKLYEAGIPNLPWESMSEERRKEIIENYRKLLPRS